MNTAHPWTPPSDFTLHRRDANNAVTPLASFSIPFHPGFSTYYADRPRHLDSGERRTTPTCSTSIIPGPDSASLTSVSSRSGGGGSCLRPARHADLRRCAGLASLLSIHRSPRELRDHRRLRRRELLSRRAPDAGADGRLPRPRRWGCTGRIEPVSSGTERRGAAMSRAWNLSDSKYRPLDRLRRRPGAAAGDDGPTWTNGDQGASDPPVDPHQFGTQDYTVTVLSATHFSPVG